MFSNASFIINEILDAAKNNSADDQCPKHVIHSSKFLVKSTPENRVSIGKDGNGAWIQGSSAETALILTKNGSYQIVHHDVADQYFYLERVGRQYVQRHVEEKDVVVLKRFASQLAFSLVYNSLSRIYATNKADPEFRRMISYLTPKAENNELNNLPLPIFVQYTGRTTRTMQQLPTKPHGNATKSTRPFTSTAPLVLQTIRVCL